MNVVLNRSSYDDAAVAELFYVEFKKFWLSPREKYYSEEKTETPSSEE